MKGTRTTIYDIAKKLNITAATVSRALNNNPKISKATRKLVMDTAVKMNYQQNKMALALKVGRSKTVGVIVPRINRNFFSSVIRGIEEVLCDQDYHVIISQSHDEDKLEVENLDALLNAQVDCIFMSPGKETEEKIKALQRVLDKKVPIIFFDRKYNLDGVSSVIINDHEGGYKATQHLIDEGCRRIAHFAGDQSIEIYQERLNGYKKALEDNQITFNEDYIIQVSSNVEEGIRSAKQLLDLAIPPDAIFSSSDYAALGAIQELRSRNIKIPEEVCVIGFSNEPFTKYMELAMSSVDQAPLEMGKIAGRVFLEQVNNSDKIKIEKKVVLSPVLIKRPSSNRSLAAAKRLKPDTALDQVARVK